MLYVENPETGGLPVRQAYRVAPEKAARPRGWGGGGVNDSQFKRGEWRWREA